MYRMGGAEDEMPEFPVETSLVLNLESPLIQKLISLPEAEHDKALLIAGHIYKLSLISQRKLNATEMEKFLNDGFNILELL